MSSAPWIISLIIVAGILSLFVKSLRGLLGSGGGLAAKGAYICTHCGSRGEPATRTRGHFAIELILWLCFIVPGLIYSIWRISTRYKACPACGARDMIPANSPMGRRLVDPPTQKTR